MALRHLLLYGLIGCFSAGLDFVLFWCLSQGTKLPTLVANSFSVLVGITVSFCLNRAFNFKVTDRTLRRYLLFLCIGLAGLCLSNFVLWCSVTYMSYDSVVAKLLSIVLVAFFQFLLNKFVTFRPLSEGRK